MRERSHVNAFSSSRTSTLSPHAQKGRQMNAGPSAADLTTQCARVIDIARRIAQRLLRTEVHDDYCLMTWPRTSPPGNEALWTFAYAFPLFSNTFSESPVMLLLPLTMGKVRSMVPDVTVPVCVADTV